MKQINIEQVKDLKTVLQNKQNTLTAGNNITIEDNTISAKRGAYTFTELSITKTTSSDTFVDLALEIQALGLSTGSVIYGEVRNIPKPTGITNAEVKIEILDTKTTGQVAGKQVFEFTLYSSDVEPYQWTFVYYQPNYESHSQTWEWQPIGGSSTTATINYFEGITGTTLNTQLALGNSVFVFKNGVLLEPTADYSISGSTITFITALVATDKVAIINGDLQAIDMTPYAKTADLATVATTGDYNDLTNKPSVVTAPTVVTNGDNTGLVVAANTIYKFSSAINSLVISSIEVSDYESVIYFTTGSSSPAITDNSNLRWGGGTAPTTLENNTVYCISIRNGLAEIDSFGTTA